MSEGTSKVSCEEFQNQLAKLLESGVDIANHPHARAVKSVAGSFGICTVSRRTPATFV